MPNLILSIDPSDFYDPDITQYHQFKECKIVTQKENKLLKAETTVNGEKSVLYLLIDKEEKHLSIIRLVKISINGDDYFQIKKSFSPVPNQGFGYSLYCLVIENQIGHIISDSFNTLPGSYNVWMKLLKNIKYKIQLFNISSGKATGIKRPINELNIWGVEEEYLEEIDATEWGSVVFEEEFVPEDEFDEYDEQYSASYLSENDKYERNMVSDFVVRALKKGKNKIKDRKNTVLFIKHSS